MPDVTANLSNNLTLFCTQMAALSIAAERVVEVIKGIASQTWLFKTNSDAHQDSLRGAAIHVLAGGCGWGAAALSNIDVLNTMGIAGHKQWSYFLGGLLASGGSAIWNHALDLLKATKVKQEQSAKMTTAQNTAASANAANAGRGLAATALPNPAAVNL